MEFMFGIIAIVLFVVLILLIKKQKELRKKKAYEREMKNRYDTIINHLSTMSDDQLTNIIVDLAMTEILYDTMLEKRGQETANRLCGEEEYGCKTHDEKTTLFEAVKKEQQKRKAYHA